MLPAISIVTPSFNQAEYLEECIESVLGQGYPRLEYVIMDGGSTDGSLEIIKKYEKHLTYWQSCPDGGHYRAVTKGFRHTTGEIMAWLNSDDKYHPLAFAKVACTFVDNPEVSWLTGRKTLWDHAGNLAWIDMEKCVFSRRKFLEGLFNKPYIQQESTFWRRSLWEIAGGSLDDGASLAGDMDLWCRFFRHAQLHTVDTLLGGFRSHGDQRSKNFAATYLQEALAFAARERQLCHLPQDALPVPPEHLALTRERMSDFINEHHIRSPYPNRTGCWCEYAEDLIGITGTMVKERRVDAAQFWQNEITLFSLTKPRILTLLAGSMAELDGIRVKLTAMLDEGERREMIGDHRAALDRYRDAISLSPSSAVASGHLLRCLWLLGERAEALGRLPEILTLHYQDADVVRVACTVLTDCGAHEQARGVCDEYLTINPHDQAIRDLRDSLERR
ncbi:glycosyltransferase family 2 protein [Geobacter argillaceus]|uniref:Glycosyl transferase family 2 n=1 Tax=Geobacter argillaceus TaxID=345631 RepID=A0A562VLM8_9BACT|nr:glycosyltransferase [Geobacter argillaceus]TWJ18863.1 glycosyl transferase family 2 [Geobacter argillaceus]